MGKTWRALQVAAYTFWRRWKKEYLPILTIRCKCVNKTENILKSLALAYVVGTFLGEDGVFQIAKMKTPTSEYVRPVSRLSILEMLR